ncbi:hypothetical protein BX666DRAFT_2029115 [Dichotomocladium elegans]|nr:hypothetical protein BX666DRAFT_2029115 [Dichotomocladium elegans]
MSSSVEAWVLMALVYKDLDDFDYRNALLLAERLYAIDKSNNDYRFVYAKCLHLLNDYNGGYAVLKDSRSISCLHLFAKCCLDLGQKEANASERQKYWSEGAKALHRALELHKTQFPQDHYWGDDLASVKTRNHTPSRASMCNLLGELYAKLENIRASSIYLWQSLADSPFKLSAHTALCDIAPDIVDFDASTLRSSTFQDLDEHVHLECCPVQQGPQLPSLSVTDISNSETRPLALDKNALGLYMPSLREGYKDISLEQLRSLVYCSHKMRDNDLSEVEPQRGEIEEKKDAEIEVIGQDIKKMITEEAYRNKHGLHKKPPTEKPQQLEVQMQDLDDLDILDDGKMFELDASPIRVRTESESLSEHVRQACKKKKRLREEVEDEDESRKLYRYFHIPSGNNDEPTNDGNSDAVILQAMNKVQRVLSVIAEAYMSHSFYHCREAALALQKLDDCQYDTPRVLCMLGKTYYDVGDYESARVFFCRSFYIAPWFCDGIPIYSTCLWYLEREQELNLLAYNMKDNRSHQYEAFIAAGNWSKLAKGGNEPSKWFQKAVDLDPTRSYGHALLGYEEWEKGNCLGAKLHFSNCMIANKRSYLGWYGMATAYQGMEQYEQAKALLAEAVLLALDEYEDAYKVICKALEARPSPTSEKLKEKIQKRMAGIHEDQALPLEDNEDDNEDVA